MMKCFWVREPRTVNGGKVLVKKTRGEWERGKVHVGCEEGWFDGFVVNWFLAGGGGRFHRCFDGGVLCWGLLSVGFPGMCSVFVADEAGSSGLLDFLGVRALGVGALVSASIFWRVSPFFFVRVTCVHPFSELEGSSGSGAGFDTSISTSLGGFSFVVLMVLMFFWAGFREVADLLAVLEVLPPALYHHHHLSFLAEYGIWDGLEAIASKTNPDYIVTMSCPGSRLQLGTILKNVRNVRIIQTVTRTLLVPMYSGWSQKNFVMILLPAIFAACSTVGSKTSHATKCVCRNIGIEC